ncbi:MAG TPA: SRPBCC family protein [Niabella sp.]|nr:SRPBCC family protein [Niabella sp.]HOZ97461.1 SRPBCC family protein [Niabella sp.]HQW15171.1 SRPBCC family protein [Niabella sp.]HQX20362.1 SRPBCC family protein [Niabella sp.]HQX41668.1 SRPBCC family protein [Niabella sp.]
MKFVRLIFFSTLVFVILALAVSFFIPSHIRVFRMVKIANGRDSVLREIKDLSQWKKWYPGMDKIELKNPETKDGLVVKATARNVLLQVDEAKDSLVVVKFQSGERPVMATWQINRDIKTDSLVLQNTMEFDLKWYPWEKFSSLLLDKSYGNIMQMGLDALKKEN